MGRGASEAFGNTSSAVEQWYEDRIVGFLSASPKEPWPLRCMRRAMRGKESMPTLCIRLIKQEHRLDAYRPAPTWQRGILQWWWQIVDSSITCIVSGPFSNKQGRLLWLTDSMPQSCIDRIRMHIVMKREKRLRAMMDNGNCDDLGIPGYRGQHKIST